MKLMPALLTSASIRPQRASTCSARVATADSEDTSPIHLEHVGAEHAHRRRGFGRRAQIVECERPSFARPASRPCSVRCPARAPVITATRISTSSWLRETGHFAHIHRQ
jgi:hypothetical protein